MGRAGTNLLFFVVQLLPLGAEELADLACNDDQHADPHIYAAMNVPKPASGFSVLILSLQS